MTESAEEILFFIFFHQHFIRYLYLCEHLVDQHQVLADIVLKRICLRLLHKKYIGRYVFGNEAVQVYVFLLIYQDVLNIEAAVGFIVAVQLHDSLTYLDQTIYFSLVIEPMLPKTIFYRFVFMVSHKIQYPSIEVFLYHWVGVYLLYVATGCELQSIGVI